MDGQSQQVVIEGKAVLAEEAKPVDLFTGVADSQEVRNG